MSRVLTSLCPACGAQVRFTGDSTVIAVCEHCSSTLLRKGQAVENLGRMAELLTVLKELDSLVKRRGFIESTLAN